ncbi:MAG: glycosyltransferase [Oscillospiraceae bacterium]|nr:glycosyltransferase [Oscillospiraceae bacterium]
MKVTIIMPAHNEQETVRTVIEKAKKSKNVEEIIVVDNASTDDTTNKIKL